MSGEAPHWGRAQLGQKGSLILCGKRTWQRSVAAGQRRPAYGVLTRALPTQPERVSTTADNGWVLERGVWRADPGRALLLTVRRHHEGMGGREGGAL